MVQLVVKENVDWTPKMIVFDKDGTLGDCTASMHNWCERMTKCIIQDFTNLTEKSNDDLMKESIHNFRNAIGWDTLNNCLLPSAPLSAGTWEEILDLSSNALIRSGVKNAKSKVHSCHSNLSDIHSNDKPLIPDLSSLFHEYFQEARYQSCNMYI
mmetsp:Transcript_22457/g.27520  ORF Transcript_22457/g.27520 Transcript_22457/m.27520 type:complete len:155 (+) Transcript_22457:268-732(+)